MSPPWAKWTSEAGWPASTARRWSPEAPKEPEKSTPSPSGGGLEAGLEGLVVDGLRGGVGDDVDAAARARARAVVAGAASGGKDGEQKYEKGGRESRREASSPGCHRRCVSHEKDSFLF